MPATSSSIPSTPAFDFVFGTDSIDLIGTGSGGAGSGNAGAWPQSPGFNGGGGGGGANSTLGAEGSFPGGGGSNGAGGGFSLKTVTGLTPGSTVAVTVGTNVNNASGRGLVIVEY
jgi:hypothetical protein